MVQYTHACLSVFVGLSKAVPLRTWCCLPRSEQQLLDCASDTDTCRGGSTASALKYAVFAKGLCGEDAYPYVGLLVHSVCFGCEASPWSAVSARGWCNGIAVVPPPSPLFALAFECPRMRPVNVQV
jgi:hypothetical protein